MEKPLAVRIMVLVPLQAKGSVATGAAAGIEILQGPDIKALAAGLQGTLSFEGFVSGSAGARGTNALAAPGGANRRNMATGTESAELQRPDMKALAAGLQGNLAFEDFVSGSEGAQLHARENHAPTTCNATPYQSPASLPYTATPIPRDATECKNPAPPTCNATPHPVSAAPLPYTAIACQSAASLPYTATPLPHNTTERENTAPLTHNVTPHQSAASLPRNATPRPTAAPFTFSATARQTATPFTFSTTARQTTAPLPRNVTARRSTAPLVATTTAYQTAAPLPHNATARQSTAPLVTTAGADLVLCPHYYLVNPDVREAMGIQLQQCIVILDEAHDIEQGARDAVSFEITLPQLQQVRATPSSRTVSANIYNIGL